jgi:hypothetical protein
MSNPVAVYLEFDPILNRMLKKKELRHGLSAAVQIGNTLWVANDETISLERLTFKGHDNQGNYHFDQHKQFLLSNILALPVPPTADDMENARFEEADIEGLDYKDGNLWLVGSHSLKRSKITNKDAAEERLSKITKLTVDGNRYLLARIPVVKEGESYTLKKEIVEKWTKRTAVQLKGNNKGNTITKKLKKDDCLSIFFDIPGKENGFDIEGIAVTEKSIFLGMRGPVLRGWAILLEVELKKGVKKSQSELKIKNIRKHFLQLGGLGIRDLCIQASDLLILAGPTMDLDGPVKLFRWKNALDHHENNFVFEDELEVVMDIPYRKGEDHAEGISLFSTAGGAPDSILVVYDAASKSRCQGESTLRADIFPLL